MNNKIKKVEKKQNMKKAKENMNMKKNIYYADSLMDNV